MNLTIPKLDIAAAKADLTDLAPRARSAIADLERPRINISRDQIPDLEHAGQSMTSALSEAGQSMSGALADAGHVVSGAVADAGHVVSGAVAAAGNRLKDLRMPFKPEPKRRSRVSIAVGGVVIGTLAVAVAAVAALLLDPVQGARRRAALRRRVDAVAERVRQARTGQDSIPLLAAPSSDEEAPIEMGSGEVPENAVDVEFSDEAVLVSATAPGNQNGSGYGSDAAVAEAGGE